MEVEIKTKKETAKYCSGDRYGMLMLTGKSYVSEIKRRMVESICDCGNVTFKRLERLIIKWFITE